MAFTEALQLQVPQENLTTFEPVFNGVGVVSTCYFYFLVGTILRVNSVAKALSANTEAMLTPREFHLKGLSEVETMAPFIHDVANYFKVCTIKI